MEDAEGERRTEPAFGQVGARGALGFAVDQELSYLDTLIKIPFEMARRSLKRRPGPWTSDLEEAVAALEGMCRLPIEVARGLTQTGPPSR